MTEKEAKLKNVFQFQSDYRLSVAIGKKKAIATRQIQSHNNSSIPRSAARERVRWVLRSWWRYGHAVVFPEVQQPLHERVQRSKDDLRLQAARGAPRKSGQSAASRRTRRGRLGQRRTRQLGQWRDPGRGRRIRLSGVLDQPGVRLPVHPGPEESRTLCWVDSVSRQRAKAEVPQWKASGIEESARRMHWTGKTRPQTLREMKAILNGIQRGKEVGGGGGERHLPYLLSYFGGSSVLAGPGQSSHTTQRPKSNSAWESSHHLKFYHSKAWHFQVLPG